MTKKVNTGLTGADTSMAAALLSAGVKPVSAPAVPAAAPAPATPTPTPTPAADAVAPATNPTSADAVIAASAQIDSEIAAVKIVWEHAKSAGVSKEQFLKLLELDPPKLAFVQQHKKQVFGSKKNALAEAAQAVINANVIASGGGEKSKKEKKSVDEKEKAIRKVFGDRKNHKVSSKGELKKADVVLGVF